MFVMSSQLYTQPCDSLPRVTLAVSTPGAGVARQYRVQFQDPLHDGWHRYGSFQSLQLARQCEESLKRRGYQVRIITYRICPAAA